MPQELSHEAGPQGALYQRAQEQGAAKVCVHGVRKGLQHQDPPHHPHDDPHGGEAVQLRHVQSRLQDQIQPQKAPGDPHRGEGSVCDVRQGLLAGRPPQASRQKGARGRQSSGGGGRRRSGAWSHSFEACFVQTESVHSC